MNAKHDAKTTKRCENFEEPRLTVRLSGKKYHLSIERAFSLAHQLVCRHHLDLASPVLEWLEEVLPNDPRVKVLLARCVGRQGKYAECSQLLNQIFLDSGELGDVGGALHTVIVYRATNLLADARNELSDLCKKHPKLPSLWLFLGDLWLAVGRPDRAEQAWQSAINHDDQKPKLVAIAATHRMEELAAARSKK